VTNESERRFLERRLSEVRGSLRDTFPKRVIKAPVWN
jgi:hypothetical protein